MINFVLTTILSYVLNKRTILELYVLVFISMNCFAKTLTKRTLTQNALNILKFIFS